MRKFAFGASARGSPSNEKGRRFGFGRGAGKSLLVCEAADAGREAAAPLCLAAHWQTASIWRGPDKKMAGLLPRGLYPAGNLVFPGEFGRLTFKPWAPTIYLYRAVPDRLWKSIPCG